MWQRLQSWFQAPAKLSASEIEHIERLIDLSSPHIRLARHYRQRLAPVVNAALEHATQLSQQLPPPVSLTVDHWRQNTLLQLLFATPDRMQDIVGENARLQRWFAKHPLLDAAFIGLSCDMAQKTRFGMVETAGQLRHDVPQTQLVFSQHRIHVPADSDHALMHLGAQRMVDLIAQQAQMVVAQLSLQKIQLDEQLLNARTMLRLYGGQAHSQRITQLGEALQQINVALTPDALCDLLRDELAACADIVQIQTTTLNVDRMGLIDAESSEISPITISQLSVAREPVLKKVILLLAVPRGLMRPSIKNTIFTEDARF